MPRAGASGDEGAADDGVEDLTPAGSKDPASGEEGSTHSVPTMAVLGVRRSVTLSSWIHASGPTVPGYNEKVASTQGCVVNVRITYGERA